MKKIGVVIPCYKEGGLLRRAWASLDSQSDNDFERIIINDNPKHLPTVAACRDLAEKACARVLWHEKNKGTAAARNSGCEALQTEIIVPLDADDSLPKDTIKTIRDNFLEIAFV